MPGIYKIGLTKRTPEERLREANHSDTWRPPTPYRIELAKRVLNPTQKEKTIHRLISKFAERIHPQREFFRVSLEDIKMVFDIMDGKLWESDSDSDSEDDLPYWREE